MWVFSDFGHFDLTIRRCHVRWIAEIQPNVAAESVTVTGGNDSGATRSLTAIAICMQA